MVYEKAVSFPGCIDISNRDNPVIYCNSCHDIMCKFSHFARQILDDEYMSYEDSIVLVQKRNLALNN